MYASPHLPNPSILGNLQLTIVPDVIEIHACCTSTSASCPVCGRPSSRIHSKYMRTLADLPWHGTPIRLELQARRFFCDTLGRPRQILTERLPGTAAVHSRKTLRLAEALAGIGLVCGGEPGSRLACRLGPGCLSAERPRCNARRRPGFFVSQPG
jgi:transposase